MSTPTPVIKEEETFNMVPHFVATLLVYADKSTDEQQRITREFFWSELNHLDYDIHTPKMSPLITFVTRVLSHQNQNGGVKHELHDRVIDILKNKNGRFPHSFLDKYCWPVRVVNKE